MPWKVRIGKNNLIAVPHLMENAEEFRTEVFRDSL